MLLGIRVFLFGLRCLLVEGFFCAKRRVSTKPSRLQGEPFTSPEPMGRLDAWHNVSRRVLVTGGAGFIGSFLTDALVRRGDRVTVYDSLDRQVHGRRRPTYLNAEAEFVQADIRDAEKISRALRGVNVVFHLAARVGVGQSNYEIYDYADVNIGGTARLMQSVIDARGDVEKVIMTASMTSYGEGDYDCPRCGLVRPDLRSDKEVDGGNWEPRCSACHSTLGPKPTPERTELKNNSVYSITKATQEHLLMHTGRLFDLPTVAMRCFNVYGPRQSLSNPYTGVAAIFISRIKAGRMPILYEDGLQTRDFVSVHDVTDALVIAMDSSAADGRVFNVGSGSRTTITEIAQRISALLGGSGDLEITGTFRKNDIRHCYADISQANTTLGWRPKVLLENGLRELIEWAEGEESADGFEAAQAQLRRRLLL